MKQIILVMSLLFISQGVCAQEEYLSWQKIKKEFERLNLNTKALSHLQCFFTEHENTIFRKKISFDDSGQNRCSGDPLITLDSKRIFAIIDYTKESNEKRMHLVDRLTGKISQMAVAHGRFKAGFLNPRVSFLKNSISKSKYYSNELNSNAPSSGFFVAGIKYKGKFKQSLTLHGLEESINDNACERAIVFHKHLLVSSNAAYVLSSGCPMVSRKNIDKVISSLQSKEDTNGGVVFIYGEREKNWPKYSCPGNFNL